MKNLSVICLLKKAGDIDALLTGATKNVVLPTTRKSVSSANFTGNPEGNKISGVGEIQRGMPFMRDLFQVVKLGSNTFDTVSWWEQLAITNNAKNVAEIRTAGSQSNLTWTQKTLNGRRIFDYIKVGADRIKDVDFVMGEVQRLVNKNMRLKENDQLINGIGTGNEVAGLLTYSTAFDTTGIKIQGANLVDLLGKIKTQIDTDMLGGAMPNAWVANRVDVDSIRYAKNVSNDYLFQAWALGNSDVNIGGMTGVENPLMTANTLLAGDFNLGTLYVWDDMVIEIGRTEDDMLTGLVTITAYIRENLRIQDVDKKAFVHVSDITATLQAINLV